MSSTRSLRHAFLYGAAVSALTLSGTAWAQDADADEEVVEVIEETVEEESRQEKIVVTGSLLQRDGFNSSSPIQVINADVASLSGLVDTAAILQNTSAASGSTQLNGQFNGFVIDGGVGVQTVSLRGLGATRTLVLLNGHRHGPSGVRGAVQAFDFNVLPAKIVQRYDVLKDGASSIYGSDAVAGVINVITRSSIDDLELDFTVSQPFQSGGEQYAFDIGYGFDIGDNGNAMLAGSWSKNEALRVKDRDFLSCPTDLRFDPDTGESLDDIDASINADINPRGCQDIYYNTAIDFGTGLRYVPSPDGVVSGPIPGYRPRNNGFLPNGQFVFEDDFLSDLSQGVYAINQTERLSLYGLVNVALGGVDWTTDILYTNRKTEARNDRQFFPFISPVAANVPAGFAGTVLPVTVWPLNNDVDIDYFTGSTTFSGGFGNTGFLESWTWDATATYTKSDGTYSTNVIKADVTGDVRFDPDGPDFNYFTPEFLSGNYSPALFDALSAIDVGNTVYEQTFLKGIVTGGLFELPAGEVGIALGAEYQVNSIDDTPGAETLAGNSWGLSSAIETVGEQSVYEVFGEVEVPLLKGVPFAEALTLNASGRYFDYELSGEDSVYKVGLDWQINPTLRARATNGTAYRAPALFELFLGDQTSFIAQTAIDPCIDWGLATGSPNLQANCASLGIPATFAGTASSATVITGGGGDSLSPETSESSTIGIVFTPTFADLNFALDYFEIEVNDQIAELGAATIVGNCYNSQNFPNQFCDLIVRDSATGTQPFAILTVEDSPVNVDTQINRGFELTTRYEHGFNFGDLLVESTFTWQLEDTVLLFARDPNSPSNVNNNDFNGTIGDPSVTGGGRVMLERGNWEYQWQSDFVGHTSNARFFASEPEGLHFDAEATWYHNPSVRWKGDTMSVTLAVRNLFDEEPPLVSAGVAIRRGNTALNATQYPLRGRTGVLRVSKTF